MIEKEYTDSEGYKQLVLMPDDAQDVEVSSGIDIGIDLRDMYPDGLDIRTALQNALFERGFKKPSDLTKPNAFKQIRSAILSVTGLEAHRIIEFYRNSGE